MPLCYSAALVPEQNSEIERSESYQHTDLIDSSVGVYAMLSPTPRTVAEAYIHSWISGMPLCYSTALVPESYPENERKESQSADATVRLYSEKIQALEQSLAALVIIIGSGIPESP